MPIKDLISPGVGFTPHSVKFIVTRGMGNAVVAQGPSANAKNVYRRTPPTTDTTYRRT